MDMNEKQTILSTIISASEKLEGSKLDESVLKEISGELGIISDYIKSDEITSIFFTIIFVLQSQRQSSVSMHDIAEFLDYSFLHILEYRKKIDDLEKKNIIYMKQLRNVSHHPENNGYDICGTVLNNVIDNEPIEFLEEEEKTTETVLQELIFIQLNYLDKLMSFSEYKRQMTAAEKKNSEVEAVRNIIELFPEDFDSRMILYYLCHCAVVDADVFEEVAKDGLNGYVILKIISPQKKNARRNSLFDDTDPLIKKKILWRVYEKKRGSDCKILFRITPKGMEKIFGSEANLYQKQNYVLTEIDKTVSALMEFGYEFGNDNSGRFSIYDNLKRAENKYMGLSFFKKIQDFVMLSESRFLLYDCVYQYVVYGCGTSLSYALHDIYGYSPVYFMKLRSFLDEEHELIKKGFLELEKNEDVEKCVVSVSDKTLEFLYGENADLYIKSVSGRNIIDNEKIKEKQLFYSSTVQKQIDVLSKSMKKENFEAMQKRLSQKGLPRGVAVLLYGAPGTGKTETVYQLAKQTNRKIFHVDIAESKSMWFGESEKKIKAIFTDYGRLFKTCKRHGQNTPILLFNEADALISRRRNIDSGNCAQTENAIQNILLEEMEKFEGIMIATTNLCENMDKAFERRFLFKVKYEKPTLEARENIWRSKMTSLENDDITRLAEQFDFSGGEIDNVVRKCEMNEIIKGTCANYEEIVEMCKTERLENCESRRVGFCV